MKTHWHMRWDGRPGLVTSSTKGRVGGFWVLPRRGGLGALTAGIAQMIRGYARGGRVPREDTDRAMAAYRALVKADFETDAVERGDASARDAAEEYLQRARASWRLITMRDPGFGTNVLHRLMVEEALVRTRLNAAIARLAPSPAVPGPAAPPPPPVRIPEPAGFEVPSEDQRVLDRMTALFSQAEALAARGADFMLPASAKAGEAARLVSSLRSMPGQARGAELLERARRMRIPFTREDALRSAAGGALEALCRMLGERLPLSWAISCPEGKLTTSGKLALWAAGGLIVLGVLGPYVAPITRRL